MLLRMNPAEWRIWLLSFQKFLERKGEVPQPPLEVPFTIYKVYPYQFFYICSSVIASLDLLIISIFCFHLNIISCHCQGILEHFTSRSLCKAAFNFCISFQNDVKNLLTSQCLLFLYLPHQHAFSFLTLHA
jgi:hypothetical protein